MRNILFALGIIVLLFPLGSCTEYYTVNYTQSYDIHEYTMSDDTLYINIPQGNFIDFIEFKPEFLPTVHTDRNISTTVYLNDQKYEIIHNLDTSAAILNLFSTNLDVKLELLVDEQQNYLSEFNQKVFSSCWFTTYIKLNFGNSADITDEQIGIETHIISNKGKIRYEDTISAYDTDSFICSNITINKNGLDDVKLLIGYRLESVKSKEYYISQLSPTLENIYKIGFNWMDKDNYILNLFLITDYVLSITMFVVKTISMNLPILTFIMFVFVIPFIAFYNSRTQSGFIDNMFRYYGKSITGISAFMRYMVILMVKCIEIVRSLIPFV